MLTTGTRSYARVVLHGVALTVLLGLCRIGGAEPVASETPVQFMPRTGEFDYVSREAMIPMRDGVRLYTLIMIPRGAHRAPILLTRTPYGAGARIAPNLSAHLGAAIGNSDVADEALLSGRYIRVLQDVRGKHKSEGDYVMTKPLRGALNGTATDHSTDTYDTIDWLVKNTPESNGKVGILGISYDGFTSLMALFHPHPALRAAVPINAMADGWMGDDWFHNGAFRLASFSYVHDQEATRASTARWWSDHYDDFDSWLAAGSAGDMARQRGLEQLGFARELMRHPAYDAFWQRQAIDKLLAKEPLSVPVMLVHGLWDQEDIYGNIAVYKAIKPQDADNSKVFLVVGPWFHHQVRLDGSAIGAIRFGSDTAEYFRRHLLRPFLDHFLTDEAPPLTLAPVNAFETGTNEWQALSAWPMGCPAGCRIEHSPLFLRTGGGLSFDAGKAAHAFDSYVSDPAKPVPYLPRPIHIEGDAGESRWQTWLVSDQREASGRPDVLSFTSEALREPLKISGQPIVNLIAATTGTDMDLVVKLIDVYPDEMGREPGMGGYQLMVSADILRGRYRAAFDIPSAIPPGEKQLYRFALPTANHVFLPGHRLMVQIQSSWFPLYDRNPQTYVKNIFFAAPTDYKKSTIRIYEGPTQSFIDLPISRRTPN